jgi:hypothetical protein
MCAHTLKDILQLKDGVVQIQNVVEKIGEDN